jgi:hypothetical protein
LAASFFSAEQVKQMDAKRSITFFMEIRQTGDETTRTDTVNNHGTLPRTRNIPEAVLLFGASHDS